MASAGRGDTLGTVSARLPLLVALALLLILGPVHLPAASADDTADARKAFRSAAKGDDWKLRREAYLVVAD